MRSAAFHGRRRSGDPSSALLEVLDPELGECDEGCLSVPGYYETVNRPRRIAVTAMDRDGQSFSRELDGLLAICLQHEIDHLDGKLFVDYLSPLKRRMVPRSARFSARERPATPGLISVITQIDFRRHA